MAKLIPNSTYDLAISRIATTDTVTITTAQPTTYFEAVVAPIWITLTAYVAGNVCRSPTDNNKVYECTVVGTSGASEPAWGIVNDGTFTDGTVTWKTHSNIALAGSSVDPADKVIADRVGGGRQITFAEKSGVISFRGGVVTHTAYINSIDRTIEAITTSTTTAPADDVIVSGRTIIFHASTIAFRVG